VLGTRRSLTTIDGIEIDITLDEGGEE